MHCLNGNILSHAYGGLNSDYIYITLERYFNDGSPSGFELNIPNEYHPIYGPVLIKIPYFVDRFEKHVQIGEIPESLSVPENNIPFFIHPYVASKDGWSSMINERNASYIEAQPTASGRTVFVQDSVDKWFLKLNYPYVVGRFKRELSLYKWLSALERSRELELFKNQFPRILSILTDYGGTFHWHSDVRYCFGTLYRKYDPVPVIKNRCILVPSFSLFSKPKKPREQTILADFIQYMGLDYHAFSDLFLRPIFESYSFMCNEIGLIPEYNSQNVLFQFDLADKTIRVVLRDHGDSFVDNFVREKKGLHKIFCTYKNIENKSDSDFYKRRSFAYDFKLSRYLVYPLIDAYCFYTGYDIYDAIANVKALFYECFSEPNEYFKSKKWYSYENTMGVSRGSYKENVDPLFR